MRMRREQNAGSSIEGDRMRRKEGASKLKARLGLVVIGIDLIIYLIIVDRPNFDVGLAAYDLGEYASALEEWALLSKDGDSYERYTINGAASEH